MTPLADIPARFNLARHCLADNAARRGDKTALVMVGDGGREETWTFHRFDETVRRLAAGLTKTGLSAGDRVLIRMANDSDYALMFFAVIAAGCVATPSSPQLTGKEALYMLRDSGATAVLLSGGLALSGVPEGVIVLDTQAISRIKATPAQHGYADTAAHHPAFLIYTSGTAGRPKGVLHAQRVILGRKPMYDGWLGLGENDVMLHAGAFNWTYTLGVGLMDPWACGAGVILYNGPRDRCIWPRLIERYRATLFAAVPTVYRQLLKYCDLAACDLTSLRHGLTAGEALSPALLESWRAATGKELYEALGMSEISTYVSSGPGTPVKPGSPGRAQPGRRIAVLPVEGGETLLPPGETGLLAVHRSDPGLMLGYWNRPEEEAEVMRGEWFTGGDLASLDEDGYVWYRGRNDDVMNAFGYRVSPLEVETVLAGHPAVAEVAVTEVPVRDAVSVIAAFVVPRDAEDSNAADLLRHAAEHLAPYKCPREIVFVDRLPRTANGKVVRRQLREFVRR